MQRAVHHTQQGGVALVHGEQRSETIECAGLDGREFVVVQILCVHESRKMCGAGFQGFQRRETREHPRVQRRNRIGIEASTEIGKEWQIMWRGNRIGSRYFNVSRPEKVPGWMDAMEL